MTMGQRKNLVDQMARRANNRLEALSKLEIPSPAFNARQVTDSKGNKLRDYTGQWQYKEFQSTGKNSNQLANELKFLRMFLSNETSTVSGAKRNTRNVYSKVLGISKRQVDISKLSYDETKLFWEAYNKVLEANKGTISTRDNRIEGRLGSSELQQKMFSIYEDNSKALTVDGLIQRAEDFLTEDYETREY